MAREGAGPAPPAGLDLAITGSAVVGHDINTAANESIHNTTWATIILVVVILLVVYRSPLLAMVPLVTIALSVLVSRFAIALLTTVPGLGFQVINITRVFVIVVLFGAGTDYCLFLIARYSEELARGRSRVNALREAIGQVGGALVASAGTVIIGLGMLFFSSFAKIKYTGPTIALSLTVALAASLTMAPRCWPCSAARSSGRSARWVPSEGPANSNDPDAVPTSGFWVRAADLIVTHPVAILSVCLAALVPLAVVGAGTRANYNQLADLDPDRPSVVGSKVIRRHFAVGELSPAAALVENRALDFRSPRGRAAIAEVSRRLEAVDLVAEVRSLTQPVGKPMAAQADRGFFGRLADPFVQAAAESRYVSVKPTDPADTNHITRFDIVFKTDPFSEVSLEALDAGVPDHPGRPAPGQPLEGTPAWASAWPGRPRRSTTSAG